MWPWTMLAIVFIVVHAPDGREIDLNAGEISTIREPGRDAKEHFAAGANCIVVMTNGKFVSTKETCLEIVEEIAKGAAK